jgi:hypothetical protein
MDSSGSSLRSLIDKWIELAPSSTTQVVRISRPDVRKVRCVCIEVKRAAGPVSLMFFRHGDGSWCVFPPASSRPTLNSG